MCSCPNAGECTYDRNLHAGVLNRLLDDAKSAAHLADLCYIVIIFPAVARGGPGHYSALDDVCHGSAIQISNYASTFPETGRYLPIVERWLGCQFG